MRAENHSKLFKRYRTVFLQSFKPLRKFCKAGSGSASGFGLRKTSGSRSATYECGSTAMEKTNY